MPSGPEARRIQSRELVVLLLLYLLQISMAEMLRRAASSVLSTQTASGAAGSVSRWSLWLATHVHPVAMLFLGIWLALVALRAAQGKVLPRWSLDGPGVWFSLRLLAEFITINGLIFESSRAAIRLLLGQIVVYLPYFVICWGWIFHRFDRIGQAEPGGIVQLTDVGANRQISSFDYFHATITTLLNRGKPTIAGTSRGGRVLVLLYLGMVMALYAVAFARILQLTRAMA